MPTRNLSRLLAPWEFAAKITALSAAVWLAVALIDDQVEPAVLRNSSSVLVVDRSTTLSFQPAHPSLRPGLLYVAETGRSARSYAALLRPIAERGFSVVIVRAPPRIALAAARLDAWSLRVGDSLHRWPTVKRWVVAAEGSSVERLARAMTANAGRIGTLVWLDRPAAAPAQTDFQGVPVFARSPDVARADPDRNAPAEEAADTRTRATLLAALRSLVGGERPGRHAARPQAVSGAGSSSRSPTE